MSISPILEESFHVYFRTREYRRLHILYLLGLAVVTFLVWPSRGFMDFFSTDAVPSAFQVVLILQLLVLSAVTMYTGMDRVATGEIIRYSEWIGRTPVSPATLMAGKLIAGGIHTLLLVTLGLPFLVISAGPAGIPLRAVFSSVIVLLLVLALCRTVGMVISVVGEESDVTRIVGSWIFLAILYLGTIQILQPLNPIIAVSRQQDELSPLVSTVEPVPLIEHPALEPAAYTGAFLAIALLAFAVALVRVQKRLRKKSVHV